MFTLLYRTVEMFRVFRQIYVVAHKGKNKLIGFQHLVTILQGKIEENKKIIVLLQHSLFLMTSNLDHKTENGTNLAQGRV